MTTNTCMSVFNKYTDSEKNVIFKKHEIENVFWDDSKGVNLNKGYENADDVNISISTALADGIDKVTTTTGFTFNEEGLHISKSDSEITTNITEDGMTVYKNDEAVLVSGAVLIICKATRKVSELE